MPLHANPSKPREEWATLPAMEKLPVKIIEPPKKVANTFEDGGDQVRFIAEVFDGPYAGQYEGKPSRFTWKVGLTMGSTRAGAKSKLRQVAEAIYGRVLTDDEANALDIEQFQGKPFTVVGHYPKPDAEQLYLTPIGYGVYQPAAAQAAPAANVAPAAADEYRYEQGGTLRWKPGMAAWEPNPNFVPAPPPAAPATAAPAVPPPVQTAPPALPAPSVTPTSAPPAAPPAVPAVAPSAGDVDF